jgi:peptidoglycan/xylan/chitin deacetylase (PgdA/CDA1 family)
MLVRRLGRRLVSAGVTALGLDELTRSRERSEMRRRRTQVVRVLFLHESPEAHAERLRRHLSWLREHFNVIDFDRFKRLFEGSLVLEDDRPAALLTFDDGLATNYEIAAPILENAGMRGMFFVVPGFSVRTGDDARRFYLERIRDRRPPLTPMTPEQIRDLSARGHTIGNHTLSHARLSDIPEAEYQREIVESAAIIESWIGRPVEAFSWPLAWNAITSAAHRLACQRHPYCFTPCSGRTDIQTDSPRLIWRTSVEAFYDSAEFRFKCSGLADQVSAGRRRQLARMLS